MPSGGVCRYSFDRRQLLAPAGLSLTDVGMQPHHRDAAFRMAAAEFEEPFVAFGVDGRQQQRFDSFGRGARPKPLRGRGSNALVVEMRMGVDQFHSFMYRFRAAAARRRPVPVPRAASPVRRGFSPLSSPRASTESGSSVPETPQQSGFVGCEFRGRGLRTQPEEDFRRGPTSSSRTTSSAVSTNCALRLRIRWFVPDDARSVMRPARPSPCGRTRRRSGP